MKIFISWSGTLSEQVARVLKVWLKQHVHRTIEAFVSSVDIDMGTTWNSELRRELDEAAFGIICLTRENIDTKWIYFEAGVLSGKKQGANTAPFLIDVALTDIPTSPFRELMVTHYKKDDVRKLVRTINSKLGEDARLSPEMVDQHFDSTGWPALNREMEQLLQLHAQSVSEARQQFLLGANQEGVHYCPVSQEFTQHLKHLSTTHLLAKPTDTSDLWYIMINAAEFFRECKAKVIEIMKELCKRSAGGSGLYDVSVWSLLGASELLIKFRADEATARQVEERLYEVLSGANRAGKNMLEATHISPRGLSMINIAREMVRDDDCGERAFKEGRFIQSKPIPRALRSMKVFIRLRYEKGHNPLYRDSILNRLYRNINSIESFAYTDEPKEQTGHIMVEAHFPCGRFSDLGVLSASLERELFPGLNKETYLAYDVEVVEADDSVSAATARASVAQ